MLHTDDGSRVSSVLTANDLNSIIVLKGDPREWPVSKKVIVLVVRELHEA
jgi:hypothetical protein